MSTADPAMPTTVGILAGLRSTVRTVHEDRYPFHQQNRRTRVAILEAVPTRADSGKLIYRFRISGSRSQSDGTAVPLPGLEPGSLPGATVVSRASDAKSPQGARRLFLTELQGDGARVRDRTGAQPTRPLVFAIRL